MHSESRLSLRTFHLPTIQKSRNPAPEGQVPYLDYRRSSAVTSRLLAEPVLQDTGNITLDGRQWHATGNGWVEKVVLPHAPSPFEIPAPTYGRTADGDTGRQLDQLAANRRFNNEHYAEDVAKAYVMDHVGRGWSALGPMPDAVTHVLKLPSEEHFTDPVTGHRWTASGKGSFERAVASTIYTSLVTEQIRPDAEERGRLASQQTSAVAVNAAFGRDLIARVYTHRPAGQRQRGAATSRWRLLPASALLRRSRPPGHALYNVLRRRIPEASEARLVQFHGGMPHGSYRSGQAHSRVSR